MQKDNLNKAEIINKTTPIIEKAAEEFQLELLEIDLVKEFNKWHLQVFIYNPKQPVTHEDCEKITNRLAEQLDLIIPVPYYLEVSSPGTEKKLKSPKEYLIFKGNRVKIKLKQPICDNEKTLFAVIIDYSKETGLKVKPEKTNNIIDIEENNISQIKLEPEYKF